MRRSRLAPRPAERVNGNGEAGRDFAPGGYRQTFHFHSEIDGDDEPCAAGGPYRSGTETANFDKPLQRLWPRRNAVTVNQDLIVGDKRRAPERAGFDRRKCK